MKVPLKAIWFYAKVLCSLKIIYLKEIDREIHGVAFVISMNLLFNIDAEIGVTKVSIFQKTNINTRDRTNIIQVKCCGK